jgi:hypothetical protein
MADLESHPNFFKNHHGIPRAFRPELFNAAKAEFRRRIFRFSGAFANNY